MPSSAYSSLHSQDSGNHGAFPSLRALLFVFGIWPSFVHSAPSLLNPTSSLSSVTKNVGRKDSVLAANERRGIMSYRCYVVARWRCGGCHAIVRGSYPKRDWSWETVPRAELTGERFDLLKHSAQNQSKCRRRKPLHPHYQVVLTYTVKCSVKR